MLLGKLAGRKADLRKNTLESGSGSRGGRPQGTVTGKGVRPGLFCADRSVSRADRPNRKKGRAANQSLPAAGGAGGHDRGEL